MSPMKRWLARYDPDVATSLAPYPQTTLLDCLSGRMRPDSGRVLFQTRIDGLVDVWALSEAARRMLARTDWGFVHQNPRGRARAVTPCCREGRVDPPPAWLGGRVMHDRAEERVGRRDAVLHA